MYLIEINMCEPRDKTSLAITAINSCYKSSQQ